MNEFEAIDLIVSRLGSAVRGHNVVVGTGDDGAVVRFANDEEVVVTSDVLVEGRHFPKRTPGDLVGYRSVAVNVSDLVAMGSRPRYMTVALTMEAADKDWLYSFADGVRVCCMEVGLTVVGGNLARGPKSVAITALGSVGAGCYLRRSGANEGDDIWLTGRIGATSVALSRMADPASYSLEELISKRHCDPVAAYFLPTPRVEFALQVSGMASSATDVSDGLASELKQLAKHSKCGMQVEVGVLEYWHETHIPKALNDDDSYELLFTANQAMRNEVTRVGESTATPLTRIGRVNSKTTNVVFLQDGEPLEVGRGYSHF